MTHTGRTIEALHEAMQNAVKNEFAKKEYEGLTSESKEELVKGTILGWVASYSVKNEIPIEKLLSDIRTITQIIYAFESITKSIPKH